MHICITAAWKIDGNMSFLSIEAMLHGYTQFSFRFFFSWNLVQSYLAACSIYCHNHVTFSNFFYVRNMHDNKIRVCPNGIGNLVPCRCVVQMTLICDNGSRIRLVEPSSHTSCTINNWIHICTHPAPSLLHTFLFDWFIFHVDFAHLPTTGGEVKVLQSSRKTNFFFNVLFSPENTGPRR